MDVAHSDVARGSIFKIVATCLFCMAGSLVFGIDVGELGGFMAMTP